MIGKVLKYIHYLIASLKIKVNISLDKIRSGQKHSATRGWDGGFVEAMGLLHSGTRGG